MAATITGIQWSLPTQVHSYGVIQKLISLVLNFDFITFISEKAEPEAWRAKQS